jgi:hypothetical protein
MNILVGTTYLNEARTRGTLSNPQRLTSYAGLCMRALSRLGSGLFTATDRGLASGSLLVAMTGRDGENCCFEVAAQGPNGGGAFFLRDGASRGVDTCAIELTQEVNFAINRGDLVLGTFLRVRSFGLLVRSLAGCPSRQRFIATVLDRPVA